MYDDTRLGPQVDNTGNDEENNPKIKTADALPPGYGDYARARESGGNVNAKNPRSSATGPDQFTDRTWLDMVRKYRPDVAQGRSDKEILGLRNNSELSGQMRDAYAGENAAVLKAHGLPVNNGTLYLSHFLGPQGAVNVLTAPPDTPMAQLVKPDALSANQFLYHMTAGQMLPWASGTGRLPSLSSQTVGAPAPQGGGVLPALPQAQAQPQQIHPQMQAGGGPSDADQIGALLGMPNSSQLMRWLLAHGQQANPGPVQLQAPQQTPLVLPQALPQLAGLLRPQS